MSRTLGARVARLAERLGRAGGFRWPAGPVESWPEGEQDRLVRLMAAGGGLDWAATARLTDADLEWLIASGCGDAGVEAAAAGGAVLTERLGLGAAEIAALEAEGIIGTEAVQAAARKPRGLDMEEKISA